MIIQVIQLSATEVTCACFRRSGKGAEPVSGLSLLWSSLAELAEIFKEQSRVTVSEEVRTVLAVPLSMVTLRELNLPITDPRKIQAVLPLELSGETAAESSALACDAVPLANGNFLAGWLSCKTLEPLIEILKEAGMEPEIITVACFHWHLLLPANNQTVALHDNAALMVLQNTKPAYYRHLDTVGATVDHTLSAVALTHNLHVSHRYFLGQPEDGNQPSGSEPLPLSAVLANGDMNGDMSPQALASPLAVAQAFCSGGRMFNLRTGPLAWTGRQSRFIRSLRLPIILAIVFFVVLFAELGIRWHLLSSDLSVLNHSIAKIYKEIFPARKKAVDENAEIKAEIRRLENTGSSLHALAFMKLLADHQGDGINGLHEIELDAERFIIKGDARSTAYVTSFSQHLIGKGWNLDQPEMTTRPDGTVLFVLRGSRGGNKP